MVLNTGDNNLVLLHEFGHVFGDLADEYVVRGLNYVDAPNCDMTYPCEWGENCYKGCTLSDAYRSSEDSIMRSYGKGKENKFNKISGDEINKNLGEYR
jgi:hypothetical protein